MNKDEIAGLIRDLRTHAYDDCGERDIPTHIANQASDALTTLSARVETLEAAAWKVLAYDQLLRKVGEIRAEALLAGDMPNVDAAYDDMVNTCVNALSGKTGGNNG